MADTTTNTPDPTPASPTPEEIAAQEAAERKAAEDAKAEHAASQRKAKAVKDEPPRQADETVPGGRYLVDGELVDANGKKVKS